MSARQSRFLWLASALAGSCALVSCPAGSAAPALPAFDSERAWTHLRQLVHLGPRPPGTKELEATRQYIAKELTALGLAPVREDFTAHTPLGDFAMANVYADLAASAPDAELLVLATHFDTKLGIPGFVGANDGGSGTAAQLELARVIVAGGARPLTYRFLFLDGEEATRPQWEGQDNCYGSRHHAAGLAKTGAASRVRALVLLDMVGDRELRLWRESWSDRRLMELFRASAEKAGLGQYLSQRSEAIEDDHQPFLALGIPAIDLIDFEYGPGNSVWHTSSDDLDHCSQESLGAIGKLVLAALPEIEEHFARR